MMVRALIAILSAAPVVGFGMLWTSKYVVRAFGLSQGTVGHYVWLPPLGLDVGALLFGDLAARHARRSSTPPRLLFLIATALACSIACLPLAETAWSGVAIVAVSLVGGGAIYTLVTTDLLARMPPETISFAGGILTGAQSLALIVASPLIGRSVDAYQSFDTAAIALGAIAIPGAVIWLAWRTPR
jgi:MFS family permease